MPVVIQPFDRFDPIRSLFLVQVPLQSAFWSKVVASKDVYGHECLARRANHLAQLWQSSSPFLNHFGTYPLAGSLDRRCGLYPDCTASGACITYIRTEEPRTCVFPLYVGLG